jgi:multidrug efflux pump subunit AcrB
MLLAALLIAAGFSLAVIPLERLPEYSVPVVTVETVYPGMAADDIRTLITIPIEDSLSPVKGLTRIRSVSRDDRSIISLEFRWGTDPMAASVLVREAVDTVYPGLPDGIHKPAVTAGNPGNIPHAIVAIRSRSMPFAHNLAEYEIRARLRRIDGVGMTILAGGEKSEQRLELDIPRLTAIGISPQEFVRLFAQETSDIPAGTVREGNMELVVVSSGRPESIMELSQIILPVGAGTLRVRDAGEISNTPAKRESIFVYNGKEAAALEIFRRPGADPMRLSRDIKKTLEEANSFFPQMPKYRLFTIPRLP